MKTILIIGSSGGIGTALTDYFKQQDCQLVLHYFNNRPLVEEDENTMLLKANITEEQEVVGLMEAIKNRFGKLDVVINNAGFPFQKSRGKLISQIGIKLLRLILQDLF